MPDLEKCIAEIEFRFPCVRDHEFTSKEWQTLKSAVLAQQTTNKQSTPCYCKNELAYTVQKVVQCGKCGKCWLE